MSNLSRRLKQLEHELRLLHGEAMLLEELDGFIAGLLVCPDLIKPAEWLPFVWGINEEGAGPAFGSPDHLKRVLDLVMEHYNDVALTLFQRPERYAPLFAVDMRNSDILWEIWIEGFEKAIKLRPAAWRTLLNANAETAQAFSGLLTLADINRNDPRFSEEQRAELTLTAPDKIGPWVIALHARRLADRQPFQDIGAAPSQAMRGPRGKIGRNDPCPCGSGNKYKKCCGLNGTTTVADLIAPQSDQ